VVVDLSPERVLDAIAGADPAGSISATAARRPADGAFAAGAGALAPRAVARAARRARARRCRARARQARAPRRTRFARTDALPRLVYRRALDQLADAGAVRRFGETRERFAQRVGARAPSFARLTALHLRDARGGAGRGEPAELRRLGRSVAREVAGSTRAWRRALGFVNPFSWLLVR
jgi:hypothetical protein